MWVLGSLVLAVAGFASASQPWSSALVVLACQVPGVAVVSALLWGRYAEATHGWLGDPGDEAAYERWQGGEPGSVWELPVVAWPGDGPEPAVAAAVSDAERPAAVAGPDELARRRAAREAS